MCESEVMKRGRGASEDPAITLSRELVRAWRGRRSQRGASLRFGYASNVVNAWESGRRWPTAADAFAVARRAGVDLDRALRAFFRVPPPWVGATDPATREGVVALLSELKGRQTTIELAARARASRFAVARWLKGQAEPRLPELLRLVEAASGRMHDLAAVLTDPRRLPSLRARRETLAARMALAATEPWSQAVLATLCLHTYGETPAHDDVWVAGRLGIGEDVVRRCLDTLVACGQIRWDGGHYEALPLFSQDAESTPEARHRLKTHWAKVGLERMPGRPGDLFSTNFFTASAADAERLRQLHVEFFGAVREVVAHSSGPLDRIVVVNTQTFGLG